MYSWYIFVCTHETYPQIQEMKRVLQNENIWEFFQGLQILLNSLMYAIFQANSRPEIGLEAHSTDTRTQSSTISFCVLVALHLYILDGLFYTPQLLAQRKGKVREVTRHFARLFMLEIKQNS